MTFFSQMITTKCGKTNVFNRLLTDSLDQSRKRHKQTDQERNNETHRWETLLASNGKLSYSQRPKSNIEIPVNNRNTGVAPMNLGLPPSSYFLPFPKEKVLITPKSQNGKIATKSLARSVYMLKKTKNTRSKIDLISTPTIDLYPPKPVNLTDLEYKPLSATLNALERFAL